MLKTLREHSTRRYARLAMNPSIVTASSQYPSPTQQRCRGEGNKILVGTVVKAKVSELEYDIWEGFCRQLRKELTSMV